MWSKFKKRMIRGKMVWYFHRVMQKRACIICFNSFKKNARYKHLTSAVLMALCFYATVTTKNIAKCQKKVHKLNSVINETAASTIFLETISFSISAPTEKSPHIYTFCIGVNWCRTITAPQGTIIMSLSAPTLRAWHLPCLFMINADLVHLLHINPILITVPNHCS